MGALCNTAVILQSSIVAMVLQRHCREVALCCSNDLHHCGKEKDLISAATNVSAIYHMHGFIDGALPLGCVMLGATFCGLDFDWVGRFFLYVRIEALVRLICCSKAKALSKPWFYEGALLKIVI